MSSISLRHNSASNNAIRRLNTATSDLSRTFERLSSGLRINRPSDDAAGLAVASGLKMDRAVYAQGVRNLNEGISLLSIAEGALGELQSILIRVKEVANTSANGTLNTNQRKALQDEVSTLQSEYNRIIRSTSYNYRNILNGDTASITLQAGYGELGSIVAQIGLLSTSDAFGVASAGITVSNGAGSLSPEGIFKVFRSSTIDPGFGTQVYLKNLETGAIQLVSSSESGELSNNGGAAFEVVSMDGQFVVFISEASNLIPGVSGPQYYRKNTVTGEIALVSSAADGTVGSAFDISRASMSIDGRYVAFKSTSTDLIPGVTGNQIYVKDMQTGEIKLGSSNALGEQSSSGSGSFSLSADGSTLAFDSNDESLVDGVVGTQLYVKNLSSGNLTVASTSSSGAIATNGSGALEFSMSNVNSISADGRYITFTAKAGNLVDYTAPFGTNYHERYSQVYRKDLQTGELVLVSRTVGGSNEDVALLIKTGSGGSLDGTDLVGFSFSSSAQISADGRYVFFKSNANNIITGIEDELPEYSDPVDILSKTLLYKVDLETGDAQIVNRDQNGQLATFGLSAPYSINADGSKVAFNSFTRTVYKPGINELSGMVVSNSASARVTLTLVGKKIEQVNLQQGQIGASMSRISVATSISSMKRDNLDNAISSIMDSDIAKEAANMVLYKIRQQASAVVLGQANLQPELILRLLQDKKD